MKNALRKATFTLLIVASSSLMSLSYAATAVKFGCTLTDHLSTDGQPSSAKETFTTTTPEIYAVCSTEDLQKNQSVTAQWTAIDTHKAAPDNYMIAEKTLKAPEGTEFGKKVTLNFSLTKPTKDWPAGSYQLNLYLDQDKNAVESVNFTINKPAE